MLPALEPSVASPQCSRASAAVEYGPCDNVWPTIVFSGVNFAKPYHTTGAVLPSGRGLCRALAHFVRTSSTAANGSIGTAPRRILEVGPGTGAVTTRIARDMQPTDRLTLVERNEQFVEHLREQLQSLPAFEHVRDRITLVHSSLEDLPDSEPFDLIISGLPLNNFSVELVDSLLTKMQKLLAPDGVLSFFEYVAIRRAKSMVSPRTIANVFEESSELLGKLLQWL